MSRVIEILLIGGFLFFVGTTAAVAGILASIKIEKQQHDELMTAACLRDQLDREFKVRADMAHERLAGGGEVHFDAEGKFYVSEDE